MLKLSKKADYGLIAVKHLAVHGAEGSCSASEIAVACGISGPLMAKVLQKLAKSGLVVSRHGSGGGYQLARGPKEISAFEVIDAIDGPLTITSCVTNHGECEQATHLHGAGAAAPRERQHFADFEGGNDFADDRRFSAARACRAAKLEESQNGH